MTCDIAGVVLYWIEMIENEIQDTQLQAIIVSEIGKMEVSTPESNAL